MDKVKFKTALKRLWKGKYGNRTSTKIFLFLMMLIPFLDGVVYSLYLKGSTIRMMFSDKYGTGFGFYWIKLALEELTWTHSPMISSIKNLFTVMLVFNGIGLPLNIVMSFFFYKQMPLTKTFRTIFYLPNLVGAVIITLLFRTMIDPNMGFVGALLVKLGMEIPWEGLLFNPDTTFPTIIVYEFWWTAGAATILVTAAMLKIPESIQDAMRIDGVTWPKELVQMIIPLISPILSVMFLQNVTVGFGMHGTILMLTNPAISKVYTIGYVLTEGSMSGKYFEAAGRGFIVTCIAIPLVCTTRWAFGKFLPDVSL